MKAKALKAFLHDELGSVAKDQEFEATEAQLAPVIDFVEVLDAKGGKKAATDKAKAD